MALVPIIPGLVRDNSTALYEQMCGATRYRMSMISTEWFHYSNSKITIINAKQNLKDAIIVNDILSTIRSFATIMKCNIYAIQLTFKHGSMEMVNIIYNLYIKNDISPGDATWFKQACRSGNIDIVQYVISKKHQQDWQLGFKKACKSGNVELVQLMLKFVNAEHTGIDSELIHDGLFYAYTYDRIDVVKLLMEKMSTELVDFMFYICRGRDDKIRAHILKGKILRSSHIDLVQLLIDAGVVRCFNCGKTMQQHLAIMAIECHNTKCEKTLSQHLSDI